MAAASISRIVSILQFAIHGTGTLSVNWWSWDAKELGHTGSSGDDGPSANSIARASVGDTRAQNQSVGVVPGDRAGDRCNLPV